MLLLRKREVMTGFKKPPEEVCKEMSLLKQNITISERISLDKLKF